jgi:mannose-6-phosphate isomerase-like protein (cupin superfamily)
MNKVINFEQKFTLFSEFWTPKILAQFDNYHIKAAKMKGEFIWHSHADTDELFIVVKGILKIEFHDKIIILNSGECYVVPKGIEHKTVADEEVHVLFFEKIGTLNTGDLQVKETIQQEEWI